MKECPSVYVSIHSLTLISHILPKLFWTNQCIFQPSKEPTDGIVLLQKWWEASCNCIVSFNTKTAIKTQRIRSGTTLQIICILFFPIPLFYFSCRIFHLPSPSACISRWREDWQVCKLGEGGSGGWGNRLWHWERGVNRMESWVESGGSSCGIGSGIECGECFQWVYEAWEHFAGSNEKYRYAKRYKWRYILQNYNRKIENRITIIA